MGIFHIESSDASESTTFLQRQIQKSQKRAFLPARPPETYKTNEKIKLYKFSFVKKYLQKK